MSLTSKLNWLISWVSSAKSAGFQASEPSGKRMKSSMPFEGLKAAGVLLFVVCRDRKGAELVGLGFGRLDEDLEVDVEDRDMLLCDLR